LEHRVFSSGLGIVVFVNKKRLAGYLLVGFVVAALLVVAFVMLFFAGMCCTPDDPDDLRCAGTVDTRCADNESFNINEISYCDGLDSPSSLRNLPNVEDVNESTGVVTCETSAANTSN
jgi:hypothetical protein